MLKQPVMKKSGFSLTELVICISLILIFGTILLTSSKSYRAYMNKVNIDYCSNSIVGLINGAKSYCRSKNVSGSIFFDTNYNTMYFLSNSKLISKYRLPDNFVLGSVNLGRGKYAININNQGFTSDACTISYYDRKSEIHSITICVGTAYVEIKN